MTPPVTRKPTFGFLQLMKTDGVSAGGVYLATGAIVNLPFLGIAPYNPDNIERAPMANASAFLSHETQMKKSPGFSVSLRMKNTWHTATLINSLINSFNAGNNSDEFCANISDGVVARPWGQCKCTGVYIVFAGSGAGGVLVRMDFMAIAAEGDFTPPTFSTAFSTDGGTALGVTAVDFGSTPTATGVRMTAINFVCEQLPDYQVDGTAFATTIETNRRYSSITLQQNPSATTIPATGSTITVRFGGTTHGVSYSLVVSRDAKTEPLDPALPASDTREFTGFNSGANPITIASY